MYNYEKLILESPVPIYESEHLPHHLKGIYIETQKFKTILYRRSIETHKEKACIIAEEIGHYETSSGNILDQSDIENRRQEKRARQWAHQRLIPLPRIVQAYKAGVRGRYEIAEHLEVTEQFLQECINRYTERYGLYAKADDYHYVCFDPLGVLTIFE